jgi:hypothetical protein
MSKQEQLVSFVEKSSSRWVSIVDKYRPTAVRYGSIVRGSRQRYVVDLSTDAPPPGTLMQRDRHFSSVVSANADCPEVHTEAQEHSEAEAKMALWKGIKTYPQAAAWFILLSSTIIMEGYNSNLIGSLFAYPAFAQKCDGAIIRP